VPCHGGALRSGYVNRRIRAPRFPVFVPIGTSLRFLCRCVNNDQFDVPLA
jgi:hypothetical protein